MYLLTSKIRNTKIQILLKAKILRNRFFGINKKRTKMKTQVKKRNLIIAFLAMMSLMNNSIQAQPQVKSLDVNSPVMVGHGRYNLPNEWIRLTGEPVEIFTAQVVMEYITSLDSVLIGVDGWENPYPMRSFPTGYPGIGYGNEQYAPVLLPGSPYGIPNGGERMYVRINYVSDPLVKINGQLRVGYEHLSYWNGVIDVDVGDVVELELHSYFSIGNGGGSNRIYFNNSSTDIVAQRNQSIHPLNQGAGMYKIETTDGYGANGLQTIEVELMFHVPTQYTITATAGANGSISPNGAVSVTEGADQTFTFTPAAGYQIAQVKVDGNVVNVSENSYTFTNVQSAHSIEVSFEAIPPIEFTVSTSSNPSEGGTTSGGGIFVAGTTQTVVATPVAGYQFRDWTEGGSEVSSSANYQFTLTEDRTLVANFTPATGINVHDATNAIIIYPNPIENTLNIKGLSGKEDILLTDISGRILYLCKSNGVTEMQIPVNHLANGVYFVRISNGIKTKPVKRVKQL
jgi:hypothetical protein